jgi:hypothetical protein
MIVTRYLTRRHPPAAPWLADLPGHPARQRIQRGSLWLWIIIPLLPLVFIPVSEPSVLAFSSIILGGFSLIGFLCEVGLEALYNPGYQYCPKCYSDMDIGATRCPKCQFEPTAEEGTP